MDPILQHLGQVPCLLDHPGSGRMSSDPGHMHPSRVELDEEQLWMPTMSSDGLTLPVCTRG